MTDLDTPSSPGPRDALNVPAVSGAPKQRARPKWCIRVTLGNGEDCFLRHGRIPGEGKIATFGSKALAEMNAESMIAPGLESGEVVTVIRYSKDYE